MRNIDRKTKILADYCDSSTMFICLCETFLHEGVLDSEVQIPGSLLLEVTEYPDLEVGYVCI